jgi:hypothetical protein
MRIRVGIIRTDPLFDSKFYELYLLHLKIGYMKRTSSSY